MLQHQLVKMCYFVVVRIWCSSQNLGTGWLCGEKSEGLLKSQPVRHPIRHHLGQTKKSRGQKGQMKPDLQPTRFCCHTDSAVFVICLFLYCSEIINVSFHNLILQQFVCSIYEMKQFPFRTHTPCCFHLSTGFYWEMKKLI